MTVKYYSISGDSSGKTYGIYYGSRPFNKDSKLIVSGIKTLSQAQKKVDELKKEDKDKE